MMIDNFDYTEWQRTYFDAKTSRRLAVDTMNADLMSADEINQSLEAGYQDAISGRTKDAAEVFADLRKYILYSRSDIERHLVKG